VYIFQVNSNYSFSNQNGIFLLFSSFFVERLFNDGQLRLTSGQLLGHKKGDLRSSLENKL